PERLRYMILPIRICLLLLSSLLTALGADSTVLSVRDSGAKGDGTTDDTGAFQRVLDAAAKAGGGTVHAPRGNYFFAGHLNVPNGVTLEGIWQSVPGHTGLRNAGLQQPIDDGTTVLITENAGQDAGAPFITFNHNSPLTGADRL